MKIQILNPHQSVRLTIPVINTRNPPSPTTQSRIMMKKVETSLSTAIEKIETTVAEMDLSSIN